MEPRIRAYVRVSSRSSASRGVSANAQMERILAYCDMYIPEEDVPNRDVLVYEDLGVSAFSKALSERPAGAALEEHLQPGDHVVFYRLDRAFRDMADGVATCSAWFKSGVVFHDTTQPGLANREVGMLVVSVLTFAAEWESRAKQQRLEAIEETFLLSEGRFPNKLPFWLRWEVRPKTGVRSRAAIDPNKVRLMFAMRKFYDEGYLCEQIAQKINALQKHHFPWKATERKVRNLMEDRWEAFVVNPLLVASRGYDPETQDCFGNPVDPALRLDMLRSGCEKRSLPKTKRKIGVSKHIGSTRKKPTRAQRAAFGAKGKPTGPASSGRSALPSA